MHDTTRATVGALAPRMALVEVVVHTKESRRGPA
jgi:hypothetical protein